MTELSVTGNERIAMGANMSPFDTAKLAIDDLYEEAQHWLTGDGVTSHKEADAVEKILDLARDARTAADKARKVENEPFDTGKAAVQARYNPILKRAETIADTCKQVLTPWREMVAAAKAKKAELARAEALAAQEKAQAAMVSSRGNVAERVKAEEIATYANEASGFAVREQRRAETGNGLRTSYRAIVTDSTAAATHYWKTRRAEIETFIQSLADGDVHRGIRSIPGFDVVEEKTAI